MLELYNEKLLDLLVDGETGTTGEGRYDIKKDKKGMGKIWRERRCSKKARKGMGKTRYGRRTSKRTGRA